MAPAVISAVGAPLSLVGVLDLRHIEIWLLGSLAAILAVKTLRYFSQRRLERSALSDLPLLVVPRTSGRLMPVAVSMPDLPRMIAAPAPEREHPLHAAGGDESSETIRMEPGFDGRVQFLPGWLEVVRGAETGREFHFVRLPGQEIPEVTVGRARGAAFAHVQIPEPTVSRVHARLRFQEHCWQITNLSHTNPLRINGEELISSKATLPLCDGDRIQLGEVELRYRDRRS